MLKFFEDAIANSPSDLKYWPLYMYHFTDIINAVSILKQGKIFSRKQALELKLMGVDNASHEVIDQTRDFVEEYVRFYFRPLTPTQYNNEGLKHINVSDSHCPRPVFFLFDNSIVESYSANSLYGEKTFASDLTFPTTDYRSINSFSQLIYHYGSYDVLNQSAIKQYRQAEFAVKDSIDLSKLKWIVLRSNAEKEFLLYWLHDKDIYKYDEIIRTYKELNYSKMFYLHNLYIDEVIMTEKYVNIIFENLHKYDYKVKTYVKFDDSNTQYELKLDPQYNTYYIDSNMYHNMYKIKVVVDGFVMYVGEFKKNKTELPF